MSAVWRVLVASTRPAIFVLAAAVVTGLVFLLARTILIEAPPIALVQARANEVSYQVRRENTAGFVLSGARIARPDRLCDGILGADGVFSGLVQPALGTKVRYTRHRSHLLIVLERGPGIGGPILSVLGQPSCRLDVPEISFLLPESTFALHAPFPVTGPGEIGIELGAAAVPDPGLAAEVIEDGGSGTLVERAPIALLSDGSVRLFGRTTTLYGQGQVYPIPDAEFLLPRGSRLSSDPETSTMLGTVALSEDEDILSIEVTVEAAELRLFRIGETEQVETLAVGVVARAFSNPGLASLLIFIAIFAFVLQLFCSLDGLVSDRHRRK